MGKSSGREWDRTAESPFPAQEGDEGEKSVELALDQSITPSISGGFGWAAHGTCTWGIRQRTGDRS